MFNFNREVSGKLNTEEEKNSILSANSIQEIEFIFSEKSKNTVRKTQNDWKKFETFCNEKKSGKFDVNNILAKELDKFLCLFFRDIRRQDGGEYEPDNLSSFQKRI